MPTFYGEDMRAKAERVRRKTVKREAARQRKWRTMQDAMRQKRNCANTEATTEG